MKSNFNKRDRTPLLLKPCFDEWVEGNLTNNQPLHARFKFSLFTIAKIVQIIQTQYQRIVLIRTFLFIIARFYPLTRVFQVFYHRKKNHWKGSATETSWFHLLLLRKVSNYRHTCRGEKSRFRIIPLESTFAKQYRHPIRWRDGRWPAMNMMSEGRAASRIWRKSEDERSNGQFRPVIYARLGTMHHASRCCRRRIHGIPSAVAPSLSYALANMSFIP